MELKRRTRRAFSSGFRLLTVAEGEGFEPSRRCYRLRDFQSRALGQAMRPFRGGEGGIRTHGGSSPHRFSRAAPSTTRTPLQSCKYIVVPISFAVCSTRTSNLPTSSGRISRRVMARTATRLPLVAFAAFAVFAAFSGSMSSPDDFPASPVDGSLIRLTTRPPGLSRAVKFGTPGRIRTCGLWVRNPTLYPLSYRRASRILHQKGNDPPWRVIPGGKGGIRTLGAHFLRSTA
jgi:hypothetical protein